MTKRGLIGKAITKKGLDEQGYGRDGFNADGWNRYGYNRDGYDSEGFDRSGYNSDGFNRNGFDRNGFDIEGFDKDGFNIDGFDCTGYDKNGLDSDGYDKSGFDKYGFDIKGFDKDGYNARGFTVEGVHRNGTKYDDSGFNIAGLNKGGIDADGFNGDGLDPLEIEAKAQLADDDGAHEIRPIVRRAYLMCEDGSFSKADELVEKALNANPEDGDAYLAALMVEKRVTNEEQLSFVGAFDFEDLAESANYAKAMRFGSQRLRAKLEAYAERNREITDNWLLLEKDEWGERILIISRFVVSGDFSISGEREQGLEGDGAASIPGNYITWEDSVVRKWMNGTYYRSLPAFIRNRIIESRITTCGTEDGLVDWRDLPSSWQVPTCTTRDKVFSLSFNEVLKYFWNKSERLARYKFGRGASPWGLRSPGFYQVGWFPGLSLSNMVIGGAAYCYGNISVSDGLWCSAYGRGAGDFGVDRYTDGIGYRPAMWLDSRVAGSDDKVKNGSRNSAFHIRKIFETAQQETYLLADISGAC